MRVIGHRNRGRELLAVLNYLDRVFAGTKDPAIAFGYLGGVRRRLAARRRAAGAVPVEAAANPRARDNRGPQRAVSGATARPGDRVARVDGVDIRDDDAADVAGRQRAAARRGDGCRVVAEPDGRSVNRQAAAGAMERIHAGVAPPALAHPAREARPGDVADRGDQGRHGAAHRAHPDADRRPARAPQRGGSCPRGRRLRAGDAQRSRRGDPALRRGARSARQRRTWPDDLHGSLRGVSPARPGRLRGRARGRGSESLRQGRAPHPPRRSEPDHRRSLPSLSGRT